VDLVRAAEVIGEDVGGDEWRKPRDVASVFPSQKQRDKDRLADAAKELGIIRDSSAFVTGGRTGATADAETPTDGAGPPAVNPPTGHFDGSANLAEVLIKQKLERQELRDAAIKASKVPIYDDDDHSFLDEVAERKAAEARQTRKRENDALAEFKRMQSEATTSFQSADERPGDQSAGPGRRRADAKRADAKRADAKWADAKRAGRPKVVRLDVKRQKAVKGGNSDGRDSDDDRGTENLFGCYEDSD
jgi:hypothetical protein